MESTTPHDHAATLDIALDFVNTLKYDGYDPIELLVSTDDALDWLQEHGLVHAEAAGASTAGSPADERTIRRVRRVRTALRELIDATYEDRAPDPGAIAEANRVLNARSILQLVPSPDGVRLGHRHVGDPVDDALANLTQQIVREIVGGRPERLRACASDTCRWVFYDDSRTGRRRWCDMSSCGNRAKAARHRARAKAQAD